MSCGVSRDLVSGVHSEERWDHKGDFWIYSDYVDLVFYSDCHKRRERTH